MTDTSELTVDIATTDDGQPLLTITGDLDVETSAALTAAIEGLVQEDTGFVVVDLAGVPFMDSSGFGALLGIHRAGAAILVRNPTRQVRQLLDVVGVPGVVDVEG
jgi:anti-sigma B factor antagonist